MFVHQHIPNYKMGELEQHDGAILEHEIRESGITYTAIARELQANRKTLYNWFSKAEIPTSAAKRVGAIIGVDLIAKYPGQFTGDNPLRATTSERQKFVKENDAVYWKEKYLNVLEKYNAALEAGFVPDKKP
jgi:hypothetical protein